MEEDFTGVQFTISQHGDNGILSAVRCGVQIGSHWDASESPELIEEMIVRTKIFRRMRLRIQADQPFDKRNAQRRESSLIDGEKRHFWIGADPTDSP
jgi:hypothetical protein